MRGSKFGWFVGLLAEIHFVFVSSSPAPEYLG
jgi:hypothetical protein